MILLNERSQSEVYIMHHFNHITFCKRQNYGDSEKISGCQELGVRDRGRKDIPLWFEMLMVGEAVLVGRRYIGTLCSFHSIL